MYNSNNRQQLLIDIARMYYIEQKSQQQIANILHMSRSNVSLLLKSCVENNIIDIRINDSVSKAHNIASVIQKKYNLDSVLIAQSYKDPLQNMQSVARLAAHYLESHLSNGMTLGYSNDLCISEVAQKMDFIEFVRIHSVQMMGGTNIHISNYDGQELAQEFQQKLNGDSYKLHAPLLLKSSTLKTLLVSEPLIKQVFQKYSEIDIAIVYFEKPRLIGGTIMPDSIYSKADLRQLSEMNASCRLCGRFLDKSGKPCNAGINQRIMAIDLEDLKKIPVVIGISSNVSNASAVKSCALSGYINTLIIDESLAKSVI